jgi:tetratricopeptide (TPR) repeat protein
MKALHAALLVGAAAAAATSCQHYRQPRIQDVTAVQGNLQTTADSQDAAIAAARARAEAERARLAQEAGEVQSAALATCRPEICAAIGRGELMLGMSLVQALAATASTRGAWQLRGTEQAGTLLPDRQPIRDRVAEVALITLRGGEIVSYTYREASGLRTVAAPEDATLAGRRRALAAALLEQGDELVAAGRPDDALARYDQADVLDPNNPETTLRIAQLLDKQLRPVEALMRYQKFLHEMELERIRAVGEANAALAAAVVAAQARVIHLQQEINNVKR